MPTDPRVAYFSMEIGLASDVPTYSGGLGALAGDSIRSAADLGLPMVAVTMLCRKGYFVQSLDAKGHQSASAVSWRPEARLSRLSERVSVRLGNRTVQVGAWRYDVAGAGGHTVPVYLLDTDLPGNAEEDRRISDSLYGGDKAYRLAQETVLGIGGVRLLHALGFERIDKFHMNEGHAALLVLELLRSRADSCGKDATDTEVLSHVRRSCVFTTHTPVEAGHDRFEMTLVAKTLHPQFVTLIERLAASGHFEHDDELNMTHLGLGLSGYVNGVAERHGEVSRRMFPGHAINSITNGVHAGTWVAPAMAGVLDEHLPDWRKDNFCLRSVMGVDPEEVRAAHRVSKLALISHVRELTGVRLEEHALTLGFGRRAAAYKRADLLVSDPDRLAAIVKDRGAIQIVYAGKAHPADKLGQAVIERVHKAFAALKGRVACVWIPNYDMNLCRLMTAGVDVWVNTPRPPLEASGTSGMKAALNGVPSLSTVDGWWVEGWIEGVTGWSIGRDEFDGSVIEGDDPEQNALDARSLYSKLDGVIAPTFHDDPAAWSRIMLQCIAINGAFFNTQRMMQEYVTEAYFTA